MLCVFFFLCYVNVYVYVLNFVGYVCIVFVICVLRIVFVDVWMCLLCYFASFACDEFDGRFARRYD